MKDLVLGNGDIIIGGQLDADNEIEITISQEDADIERWINKEDAKKIIKHLKSVLGESN